MWKKRIGFLIFRHMSCNLRTGVEGGTKQKQPTETYSTHQHLREISSNFCKSVFVYCSGAFKYNERGGAI